MCPAMLSRLYPSECGSATSPATYTPPVPYPDTSSPFTLTTLVSPAEKTWIQQVVGSLLFYARALDLSVLTAVYQLSSHQSNPTQHDLSSAHRLLNYVTSYRNPHKTIHPSFIALWCCTDASYLSRPNSGSVAGCSVGLGDPPPYLLNPPPESRRQSLKTKQTLFSSPDHRDTWAPHGDRAFTLGPALTHYHCQRVYVVSSRSERITLTLAHFPLPLFHFAASDLPPPPTSDPSATRPSPTLDGTDLIGRVFNDPDLGLCCVVEVGPPHRLAPGEGNLDPTGPTPSRLGPHPAIHFAGWGHAHLLRH
jgi:hypothetical protein